MNTGLQDAYNLAWKLALAISGKAEAALLDSYGEERIPVAVRLLSTTDRLFSLVVSESKLTGQFRTRILPKLLALAMRFKRVQKLAFRTISQTGIRYRGRTLSENLPGLPSDGPQAGDRFPWMRLKFSPKGPPEDLYGKLDDTRFTLLLFGQAPGADDGGAALGDMVRTLEIHGDPANDQEVVRVGIPPTAFYLLRPDCYIGLAGTRLEAAPLSRYISQRLRFRPR